MKRKSLFTTLILTYIPVSLIGVFTVAFFINDAVKEIYLSEKEKDLESRVSTVAFLLSKTNFANIDFKAFSKEASKHSNMRVTIIDAPGNVLGDSNFDSEEMDNHLSRPEVVLSLKNGTGSSVRHSKTLNKDYLYLAKKIYLNNEELILRGAIEISLITQLISTAQINTIYLALAVSLILMTFSFYASKQISNPLVQLRKAAGEYIKTFQIKNLDLPKTSNKEIAILSRSFKLMAKEIKAKIDAITVEKNERESVLASLQEGLIVLDKNIKILSINDVAKEYLSLDPNIIEGKRAIDIIKNKKMNKFFSKIQNSKSKIIEKEIKVFTNKNRFFLFKGTSLKSGGEQKGYLISINDITLVKQLEKVRQDFVSNVSHELKTPITSIAGFLEVIKNGEASKSQEKQFINKVLNQTNRMNNIIDDLLKLSKIESQEEDETIRLKNQLLIPIIESAIENNRSLANQNANEIQLNIPPEIKIKADAALFSEAISNLLHNAIKYGESDEPIFFKSKKKSGVEISIENRGTIIPQKYRERIFQRFFTVDKSRSREKGGTGLGLSIVKHIVLVHGGTIRYDSDNKKTNRFIISLPN